MRHSVSIARSFRQVIDVLHSLGQSGCTIACALHQPSSQLISQFDDLFVLGQGMCYYCGPGDKIIATLEEAGFVCPNFYNLAEFGKLLIREK